MLQTPATAFDVRRNVQRVPMSTIERIAYESLRQIAMEGRRATQPELCAATGVGYQTGALPAILGRLETKGYIKREYFQRGMTVCLVDEGICTAPPPDTSPHWRNRPQEVPAPAIQSVRERSKPISAMIEAEARISGKHMTDFLADLVYIGWHSYQAEKEGE